MKNILRSYSFTLHLDVVMYYEVGHHDFHLVGRKKTTGTGESGIIGSAYGMMQREHNIYHA